MIITHVSCSKYEFAQKSLALPALMSPVEPVWQNNMSLWPRKMNFSFLQSHSCPRRLLVSFLFSVSPLVVLLQLSLSRPHPICLLSASCHWLIWMSGFTPRLISNLQGSHKSVYTNTLISTYSLVGAEAHSSVRTTCGSVLEGLGWKWAAEEVAPQASHNVSNSSNGRWWSLFIVAHLTVQCKPDERL